MMSLGLQLADWARSADVLLQQSLVTPTPFTLAVVFAGGLLTSLGPCSLSLLPVTLAYLAGFEGERQAPWQRSFAFAGGIVGSLVILGLASGLLGRIYGQILGLAATPCTTPVLAVLLGWMAQSGRPLVGMVLLTAFGAGQVMPLLLAGTAAASLPKLLSLRALGQWVPPISGVVLVTTGVLTLVANVS